MKRAFLIIMSILIYCNVANADFLYFSFDDPIGDQAGGYNIDVTRMDFSFDNDTGEYNILLTADAANPFQGDFRININLLNPDTGTTAKNPSFFEHNVDDYYSVSPVSTFTLSGTNSYLLSWEVGDRVATSDIPFGNPDNVFGFRSHAIKLPDFTAWDNIAVGDFTVINPVPVPSAVLLGMLGLSAVGMKLRKFT